MLTFNELEEQFKKMAEAEGSVYVPTVQYPQKPVKYLILGQESALAWAIKDTKNDIDLAKRRVADGFHAGARAIGPLLMHYYVRKNLCEAGEYCYTNIAKGAMKTEKADLAKQKRWLNWYPLFLLEYEAFGRPLIISVGELPNIKFADAISMEAQQLASKRRKDKKSIDEIQERDILGIVKKITDILSKSDPCGLKAPKFLGDILHFTPNYLDNRKGRGIELFQDKWRMWGGWVNSQGFSISPTPEETRNEFKARFLDPKQNSRFKVSSKDDLKTLEKKFIFELMDEQGFRGPSIQELIDLNGELLAECNPKQNIWAYMEAKMDEYSRKNRNGLKDEDKILAFIYFTTFKRIHQRLAEQQTQN